MLTCVAETSALVAPSPAEGFLAGSASDPSARALEIGGETWTYAELSAQAARIANIIEAALPPLTSQRDAPQIVAVFASRSMIAYAGSLAVFAAGRAHLALNPSYPVERNAEILRMSGATAIVMAPEAIDMMAELLALCAGEFTVIAPYSSETEHLSNIAGVARLFGAEHLAHASTRLNVRPSAADDLAYLVFTSGSTGKPKGVAITHGNLAHYMRNFRALAAPVAGDRVAQTYELTFDVALHDMFNAWWSGACLCVVPPRALLSPARFIIDQAITYWFSVASCAVLMQRQGILRPGLFPKLRVSMLCGEPLPQKSAAAWAEAAPNSVLYNVYGPTETTMELAFYKWDNGRSPGESPRGIVSIGVPFADHRHILRDEDGAIVEGAGRGELLLSGPQIGPGYWRDAERTAASFVTIEGDDARWYRTGDLIERDENGLYHFVGRIDHQIKLRGYRIELGEIEAALRDLSQSDLAVVVAHPVINGTAQGLVGFVPESELDLKEMRTKLASRLPAHMVPGRIVGIGEFPLNANRKIDRGALLNMLET